ncbi:MAG: hypothetical protein Q4E65_08225 [Clostridia bacterium]|nr:hypothetical protein [Clostridia bacterium]
MLKRKILGAALLLTLCLGVCAMTRAASLNVYCDPSAAAPGSPVTFNLVVNNDGQYVMQGMSLQTDYSAFQGEFSGPGAIAPGESGAYSGVVTMTETMLDVPITFTLHWTNAGAPVEQSTDMASATITVPTGTGAVATMDPNDPNATPVPGMAGAVAGVGVTADRKASTTHASRGEIITLTYTVTNGTASQLTELSITDKEIASKPLVEKITVEPGAVYTFEHTYTMGSSTVASAPVIAYMAGGVQGSVTVAELSLGMINTKLDVEVNQGAATAEGVNFTLYLINNGNQKISKIKIKDEQGDSVNNDTFALSVGESRTITYLVPNQAERNVVFYLTGTDATGEPYTDNTSTYTVHRYVDPSQVGLDLTAAVTETLNAQGSIKIRFQVNNTGSLPLSNLVLSEAELGEIRRQESVPVGETVLEETINVGAPRDLIFTVNVQDDARNDYTYTANVTAALVGVEPQQQTQTGTNPIDDIGTIGTQIGSSVSDALTVALVILAVLCVLSAAALITLTVLERKKREEAAHRKALRDRQIRAQARAEADLASTRAAAPSMPSYGVYDPGNTIVAPRQPRTDYTKQASDATQRFGQPRYPQDRGPRSGQ